MNRMLHDSKSGHLKQTGARLCATARAGLFGLYFSENRRHQPIRIMAKGAESGIDFKGRADAPSHFWRRTSGVHQRAFLGHGRRPSDAPDNQFVEVVFVGLSLNGNVDHSWVPTASAG